MPTINTIYIKPAKEKTIIRMPEKQNQIMPAHGAQVEQNSFWLRRLKDKDVMKTSAEDFKKAEKGLRDKVKKESSKNNGPAATKSEL